MDKSNAVPSEARESFESTFMYAKAETSQKGNEYGHLLLAQAGQTRMKKTKLMYFKGVKGITIRQIDDSDVLSWDTLLDNRKEPAESRTQRVGAGV